MAKRKKPGRAVPPKSRAFQQMLNDEHWHLAELENKAKLINAGWTVDKMISLTQTIEYPKTDIGRLRDMLSGKLLPEIEEWMRANVHSAWVQEKSIIAIDAEDDRLHFRMRWM